MVEWPDVIAVCGPCRALIGRMHNDDKHRGIRSNFCAQQGLGVACGRQQEDVDNTCEVEWTEDTCYSSGEHGLPGTHRDTDIHVDNRAYSNYGYSSSDANYNNNYGYTSGQHRVRGRQNGESTEDFVCDALAGWT